jgi:hypothetical protein
VQKLDMQKFNLKKLNGMEVKDQYQIKISDMFAAVKNLDDGGGGGDDDDDDDDDDSENHDDDEEVDISRA